MEVYQILMKKSQSRRSLNKINSLLLLIVLILLGSCSKKIAPIDDASNLSRVDLNLSEFNFDYMQIKSKIQFREATKNQNANALVRMKKDSIIWFNLTGALGVQGVRGILTKDSIKVINRVDKVYWKYTWNDLSKEFNFPVDYDLIEAMILGEMPKGEQKDEEIIKDKSRYVIHQTFGEILIDNFVNPELKVVEEVRINETTSSNSLTLFYKNFGVVNEQVFPYNSYLSLQHTNEFGEVETNLNIDHGKAEVSDKPLKFPFSIPEKYVSR